MKKLLIVYPRMMIGGSTTSLLSLLNNIDYSVYSVDLLLAEHKGDLMCEIPKEVNLLPQAISSYKILKFRKIINIKFLFNFIRSRYYKLISNNILVAQQITAADNASLSMKLDLKYDTAVSFLELWSTYYVANEVNARRKIAWIHVDYKSVGFIPRFDIKHFEKLDKIVLVSESCLQNFRDIFPEYIEKTTHIENIISRKAILSLANQRLTDYIVRKELLNFVTVARIDLRSKALDRAVHVFSRLKFDGLLSGVKWHIIGDGPDFSILKKLIKDLQLENNIKLVGKRKNPHNLVVNCDVFLLPSRYEGKPMAVTEAIILGIPAFITDYSSARDQVENDINGWIVANDDDSIYAGLLKIIKDRELINNIKANMVKSDYSNFSEMEKIFNTLFEDNSREI